VSELQQRPLEVFTIAANTLGSMPSFAASVMPSEVAIISIASIMLLQILATLAVARAPQCHDVLAHLWRIGLAIPKSRASPPTMKVRVPASAPPTPPDTESVPPWDTPWRAHPSPPRAR
jgi:hypothetical protein